jgi:tRNA(Ile)-lysidine synthase
VTPGGSDEPPPGPLPEGQSRDRLVAEVARALAPLPEAATALVAVSGGPDSTALAFLTAEARPDLVLVLGHVRHGLRDDTADVAAVHEHARFLGARLEVAEVVVVPSGEGIEAAARAHRYAALRWQAREAGAAFILLGHTAEDQAETLLMRLARGTGVPGLGGMAAHRGGLVRPLLRLRRNDVRRFVVHEGLPAVEDPTNRDPALTRTVARHQVLPALAALGPDPVAALARLADVARLDADKLDADAREVERAVVRRYGPVHAVRRAALDGLHPAIRHRVVRDLVVEVRGGGEPPSAAEVARVLGLRPGAAVDLPGAAASAGGGWLAVGPADRGAAAAVPLAVPGVTPWPAAGLDVVVLSDAVAGPGLVQLSLDVDGARRPDVAVAPGVVPPGGRDELAAVVVGGLPGGPAAGPVVRSRRPGDRVVLTAGTRKLQDVMVDAGVPRVVRDLVPVVALGDRLLWVPGLAVDAGAVAAGRDTPGMLLVVTPSGVPPEPTRR